MRSIDEIRKEIGTIQAALASQALGFAFATPDGRLLDTSPSFRRIAGYTSQELSGVRLTDFIHPEDRDGYLSRLQRLLGGEVPSFQITSRCLCKGGSTVWVNSNVSMVRDAAGEAEYLIAVLQDATETRWAEEQNARLFGFPLCLIFIAGFDGYFKRVNTGYERLLGWTEQELISRPFTDFVHPDDLAGLGAALQEVMAGPAEVINQEIRVLCKDGSFKWLMGSYRPVPEEGVMYGVAVDVTDKRSLEEQVARRSAELEGANKELEGFSYTVSHDLRAPLRAIDGFSRILLEKHASEFSGDAARYLHLVRSSTERMGHLIEDLLAFARVGRQPLSRQSVAVADLVRQAFEDQGAEHEGRRIEFSVGELPACSADPALLRQVFVNLLSNALKFTRPREVAVVEVGSRTLGNGGGDVVYFVKDNGAGFDMRYADKLFGVFQRLHREDEFEGTGVGLATVERIIGRHGGRIWAEAEPDKGATFSFTLGGGAGA